jgi:hypothetical protein
MFYQFGVWTKFLTFIPCRRPPCPRYCSCSPIIRYNQTHSQDPAFPHGKILLQRVTFLRRILRRPPDARGYRRSSLFPVVLVLCPVWNMRLIPCCLLLLPIALLARAVPVLGAAMRKVPHPVMEYFFLNRGRQGEQGGSRQYHCQSLPGC